MELSEHDRKAVKESWKELRQRERERESKIIERVSNVEARIYSLESESKGLREMVKNLELICEMQMILILGLLRLGKELERRLEFAISDEGMEHGRMSVKEMLENRKNDIESRGFSK